MNTCQVSDLLPLWVDKTADERDICLVDVRSIEEWNQCHVKDAIHIPLPLLPMRCDEITADKPIYFICLSGGRSAQAAQWLGAQREQDMTNVAGGMHAWLQMGYPIEGEEDI